MRTRGLVAMTSAQHAGGRQLDPGRVYATSTAGWMLLGKSVPAAVRSGFAAVFYRRLLLLSHAPLLGAINAREQPEPCLARRAAPIGHMGHHTSPHRHAHRGGRRHTLAAENCIVQTLSLIHI